MALWGERRVVAFADQGVKMGQGKGNIEFFVAKVPAGRVMFKMPGTRRMNTEYSRIRSGLSVRLSFLFDEEPFWRSQEWGECELVG